MVRLHLPRSPASCGSVAPGPRSGGLDSRSWASAEVGDGSVSAATDQHAAADGAARAGCGPRSDAGPGPSWRWVGEWASAPATAWSNCCGCSRRAGRRWRHRTGRTAPDPSGSVSSRSVRREPTGRDRHRRPCTSTGARGAGAGRRRWCLLEPGAVADAGPFRTGRHGPGLRDGSGLRDAAPAAVPRSPRRPLPDLGSAARGATSAPAGRLSAGVPRRHPDLCGGQRNRRCCAEAVPGVGQRGAAQGRDRSGAVPRPGDRAVVPGLGGRAAGCRPRRRTWPRQRCGR